ncbi:acetyltransferase (GNAT) family protein [Actinoalloteichus hymeniacidonis]|uniref:Acetyltransferase (GNAT) family protein n=1 Tax=Actinoalloteichus hymeniacidonis TaxID=340345 RepID=A0AAC9N183_9PSEU|nr:acetyltransferase (GNAT) family protein [Actinoalloteichus hymeniacidonis]
MIDVIIDSFLDDALVCWAFPDPADRARLQGHFHRPLIEHPTSASYLVGHDEGASVWLTLAAGQSPHAEPAAGDGAVFGDSGARLQALGEVLVDRHPTDEPHRYLPCIGVRGDRRGTGLGSALLRHGLASADADGLAVYLEASSARSRALYARHGFVDLGEPVQVADSPTVWPMRRPPRR